MSDEIDRATDQQAVLLQAAIDRAAAKSSCRASGAAPNCEECGEPIPEPRRKAAPGCRYCVACQNWLEQGHGFWPW